MIARLRRSFRIWKQCLQVIRKDRELLLFPIMSFLLLIPVTLSFILLLASTVNFQQADGMEIKTRHYVVPFLFYLVSYTVMIFFNSGLVGCALMRLDGKDPVVRDGLQIGRENFRRIVGWALMAATVGFLLKLLENIRLDGNDQGGGFAIGHIVSGILGLAWSLMTYLVVPVLVVEKVGPLSGVKRSIGLFKKTWGEQVVAGMSLGLVIFLLVLIGILPIILGSAAGIRQLWCWGFLWPWYIGSHWVHCIPHSAASIRLPCIAMRRLGKLLLSLIETVSKGPFNRDLRSLENGGHRSPHTLLYSCEP